LRKQLAEARAAIADRDGKIEKLARDVAMLQETVKHLLAQRRSGHRVPQGQGLLFADAPIAAEAPTAQAAGEDDDGANDEDDSPRHQPKDGRKRTPRKIDTSGLPHEDRVHDIPEDQRLDPVTGQPLVQIGEKVFEELDYQRAQLTVIRHRQPIYGLPPAEAVERQVAPLMADLPPRPLENCAASASSG
jgi:hypothetical protein